MKRKGRARGPAVGGSYERIPNIVGGTNTGGRSALFLITLEFLLILLPGALPPRLGNHAFSIYGTFPGGMYYFDPPSRMHFMRRDFSATAYYNGYRRHHATDELGFRKPSGIENRSLLLLGDSLIYGHGVEQEATVGELLRAKYGQPAYNMARQGDCLYQHYVLLRLFGEQLQPDTVMLFVFVNDFGDLWNHRSQSEIEQRPEASWDYDAMAERLEARESGRPINLKYWLTGLRGFRLLSGAWNDWKNSTTQINLVATAEADPGRPRRHQAIPYVEVLLDKRSFAIIGEYYRSTLRELNSILETNSADLWIVHLDVRPNLGPRGRRALNRLDSFLERTCHELGIPFTSTRETFARCPDCSLQRDGHLSPIGHQRLAAFVDRWLNE